MRTPLLALLIATSAMPAIAQSPAAGAGVAFAGARTTRRLAQGLADRATARAATVDDPVRIASISKLAVALAVMKLVEAGRLDLDRDVSAVLGWRLRNPAFPDQPVTLRQLLSHTAGVRDAADYALALDADLAQHMAQPAAWDAAHGAGHFAYANLNFPVIAATMEAATGERFDRLMARLLFDPLGIKACFNWTTCSDRSVAQAVTLYRADGSVARDALGGVRPACPVTPAADGGCDLSRYRLGRNGAAFSPQGGMRIAPTGLVKLARALTRPGYLSAASRAAMARPHWRYDGTNGETEGGFYCAYGLGVMILALPGRPPACRDDPFGDARPRIGHAGEAYGLRSGIWIDARGRGIAFYQTAVPDADPGTRSAFTAAEEGWIARLAAPATPRH
ncbi:serine hydrolase [Sphingomonas sp.]|uniref:serine hydrolase domain-containing protein n=1 Tax=Sphingomonas sp. TaxID=28214 RepID=UPI001D8A9773|nr:serine hydrolase domain-containing protein [Sphingomonas sp.]MBX9795919.1 beta-lactamase family protein [Sphingomonas sp.]